MASCVGQCLTSTFVVLALGCIGSHAAEQFVVKPAHAATSDVHCIGERSGSRLLVCK